MYSIDYKVERNPYITINKSDNTVVNIQIVGDPHLGKTFKTGVPGNRLGDREQSVLDSFSNILTNLKPDTDYVIIVGDIFDKFVVSPTIVLNTYHIIVQSSRANPYTHYFLIPGNHDLSKDVTKVSSYELLSQLINTDESLTNFSTVCLDQQLYDLKDVQVVFDYYKPFGFDITNTNLILDESKPKLLIGHFDDLALSKYSYIPGSDFVNKFDLVITGHIHTPKKHYWDGCNTPVLFSGSLQPYSHAEDPEKQIYITVNYKDLDLINSDQYKNKCVRVLVSKDDEINGLQLDCYSLTYKILEETETFIDEIIDDSDELNISSYQDMMISYIETDNDLKNKEYLLSDVRDKKYESD